MLQSGQVTGIVPFAQVSYETAFLGFFLPKSGVFLL
jgi:hypothetical protein